MGWLGECSEESTSAFKWALDALLGKRESPSLKYRKEFAQDDTNNRLKNTRPPLWCEKDAQKMRKRSNTMDTQFRSMFELLPDEPDSEITRQGLMDPIDLHPKVNVGTDNTVTDTFKLRGTRNEEVMFKPPKPDDPLISRLFGNGENDDTFSTRRKRNNLPGRFPTPSRPSGATRSGGIGGLDDNAFADRRAKVVDRWNDYVKLLDQLSINNKELNTIQEELSQYEHSERQETTYRQKYLELRQELIQELKQSKTIYDNYSQLYERYKDLKQNSQDFSYYQQLVAKLEAQIVDLTIANEENDRRHRSQLAQSQLQYEARIQELETLLQHKNSSTLNTTSTPSTDIAVPTFSPYYKYNDSIDTQFLNHIVK